tara:strand:- start:525 stop:1256 length:732 start_codon:yes stop_codon:yes gene_type:complete
MKNILCVKWGDKYDAYVDKLKEQVENNCSYDFNFYCLTDNPQKEYDIPLPTRWDKHFIPNKNHFWAYRKCYMFNENLFPQIKGNEFLFLDLDILIHNSIDPLFELDMTNPWIVRGWWNNIENCKKNYGKLKSTPLNSSIIRWNRSQLIPIYNQINNNSDFIFFTYPTIDNYFNHFWYDIHNENDGFFKPLPKGITYSWYKGNVHPDDMNNKILRKDHMICLFNNSAAGIDEHMHEISELNGLY